MAAAEELPPQVVIPLGREISRRRKQLGMSQLSLANRSGCSLRTITRIEKCEPILVPTLSRIADALDVSCSAIGKGLSGDVKTATAGCLEFTLKFSIPYKSFDAASHLVGLARLLGPVLDGGSVDMPRQDTSSPETSVTLAFKPDRIQDLRAFVDCFFRYVDEPALRPSVDAPQEDLGDTVSANVPQEATYTPAWIGLVHRIRLVPSPVAHAILGLYKRCSGYAVCKVPHTIYLLLSPSYRELAIEQKLLKTLTEIRTPDKIVAIRVRKYYSPDWI